MERLGNIIVGQVGSYMSLDENMKILKRKCDTLHSREVDVNTELEYAESSCGKKRRKVVEDWLINVGNIKNEIQSIDATLSQNGRRERLKLATQVENLTKEVGDLLEQGKFPQGLTLYTPHDGGADFLTKPLVGQAFQENLEKIWKYLMEPEVLTIGTWGMGGVGKTTLVTHIHNRAREHHSIFNDVFWVTVSQNLDICKLQEEFANAIHLKFNNEQDERKRAAMLSSELKKRRCLFILDDVWHHIDLDRVGIPVQVNGCKLIITSRSLDVCRRMDCQQKMKVEPLSQGEAWDLFQKNLGHGVALSPQVSEVASLVARECAGLPLGIITVARCMREVNDVCEWRDALRALKDSKADGLEEMEDEVFRVLQFSYSRLNDPKVQQSFLYCALYPEDHTIRRADLIQRLIDERVIEGMESRQEQFDKGHTILTRLVNSCLLEIAIAPPLEHEECVKMHDLLRDMAIKMNPQFVVKSGKKIGILTGWSEDVERVSLMNCSIQEVSARTSPRSPKLSTLLLSGNCYLRRIENSFFQHMPALEILDLTGCKCIQELPNSVSNLKNLIALVLSGCSKLKLVPSLAKLKSLERLDLSCTSITEVPDGLERLVNLTYLDLSAKKLKVFPAGILPQLLLLQFLKIDLDVKIKGEELGMLERLSTFAGMVIFDKANGFKSYVTSRKPYKGHDCSYCFVLNGKDKKVYGEYSRMDNLNSVTVKRFSFSKRKANVDVETLEALLKDVQSLGLYECYDIRNLCDVSWVDNATNNLKRCTLRSCSGLKCLVPSSGSSPLFLRNLEVFSLSNLRDLEVLFELGRGENATPSSLDASADGGAFSCLKVLHLHDCHKIKIIFHPSFLPNLRNLQMIDVGECNALQEIVAETISKGEARTSIEYALPNLTTLNLRRLPQLTSICGKTISCLKVLRLYKCHKIKILLHSSFLPNLRNLQKINVDKCNALQEIVAETISEGETCTSIEYALPNLTILSLGRLPQLTSICGQTISCPSLSEITVTDCPQLKRMPLSELPSSLRSIYIRPKEWWESAEWDHPNAKELLKLYLKWC